MPSGPYASSAVVYWEAGWFGTLPLPFGHKYPPPKGLTGRGAPYLSRADVQALADGPEGAGNIGLRLPDGVVGLDVDDYWDRAGGASLDELTGRLGELPTTWVSTARDDRSGIRFYRVAPGQRWPGQAAPGIEIIQAAHRYAVVAPSVHPEEGKIYRWVWPERAPTHVAASRSRVPRVEDLPRLPVAWVGYLTGLAGHGELTDPADLDDDETRAWLAACRTGSTCLVVGSVLGMAVRVLSTRPVRGSRHELARGASHALACLGGEGHIGAWSALDALRTSFLGALGDERDRDGSGEWLRMLRGAVRLAASGNSTPLSECDCEAMSGEGLLFESEEPVVGGSTEGSAVEPDAADGLIARMLTPEQLRDRPAPAALIEGLLTLNSASWLIAEPGAYKSFLALDWAAHVGAGRAWFKRAVASGLVLYVVAEGVAGMGPRIRAWEQRNGEMINVLFLPLPVQAGKPAQWALLIEAVRRLGPVLVILDTQARVTVGIDENDNTAMGTFVDAVEQLREASNACVLVVHHLGRQGTHARGASALDGAQDTELRLTRTAERRAVLVVDKSKHGADDAREEIELFVTALDNGGSSLVIGPPLSGAPAGPDWRVNLTLNQMTLMDVMIDIFMPVGATKAELKSEALKRPRRLVDGGAIDPMTQSSFRRSWASLVAAGRFVRVDGTQRYVSVGPESAEEEDTE